MRFSVASSLLFLCLTLLGETSAQPRGWRGIVPLHSTRSDVERVLGRPEQQTGGYSAFYRTPKETVLIQYAQGRPCGIGEKYSRWRVPKDTVTSVLVTPTQPVTLSELGIDENKYEKQQGGHRHEDLYYVNEQTGETVVVFLNEVRSLTYSPGASDMHLLCPEVPKPLTVNCKYPGSPRFKFYQNISLERENSVLDNFSIALKDEPNRTGYIIAYAGKRARVGEAKARAERAKSYLIKIRNFDPNRLKTIDGGHKNEAQVDLFVVPEGTCPPTASPTVDPRDVEIVKARRSKPHRRR